MATSELWLVAFAVVCALAAVALIVTMVVWRQMKALRVALTVLLLICAGVSAGAAAVGLGSHTVTLPNANHDAPDAAGLTVYAVTDTKATADTMVALDARTGAIRWSKVFVGDVVYIRARGPMDVVVEASKVGLAGSDVLALRASDGSTLWRRALQGGDMGAGRGTSGVLPLDANGAAPSPLYIFTSQPSALTKLFITQCTALRASDGTVLWQDTAPASLPGMYGLPVVTSSVVLFEAPLFLIDGVSGDMELRAVDARTGQTRWVTKIQQGPISTDRDVVADERAAYVALFDPASQQQTVEALRLTDGVVLWRAYGEVGTSMLGMSGSGSVLVATQTAVSALDSATGKTRWTIGQTATGGADTMVRPIGAVPITQANEVYFTAMVGKTYPLQPMVYAVDEATGAVKWTHPLGQSASLQMTLLWKNGLVYVLGDNAGLIALDAGTGAMRWQAYQTGGVSDPDWTAAPDTVFLRMSIRTPPQPWQICVGGVLYPSVWAFSSTDGSIYWRTPIAEGHAYGSTGCA